MLFLPLEVKKTPTASVLNCTVFCFLYLKSLTQWCCCHLDCFYFRYLRCRRLRLWFCLLHCVLPKKILNWLLFLFLRLCCVRCRLLWLPFPTSLDNSPKLNGVLVFHSFNSRRRLPVIVFSISLDGSHYLTLLLRVVLPLYPRQKSVCFP